MADLKVLLAKLNQNLNILREREARYGGNAPLELLNQIDDYETAIELTRQAIAGAITVAELEEASKLLNLAEPGMTFGQRINNFFFGSDYLRQQRNRQAMLKMVNDFWVKGVLEKSLYGAAMIELGMEERKEAVEHPWDMVLQTNKENRTLPPDIKIVDVFNEMDQSLLLLGEPGSGKTTILLELARDLIAQAEQDPAQPIPVVFNLSSWASKKQTIAEWLIDELRTKYNIPKKVAEPWVENDELLLLFDGLDEVAKEQRKACVQAINDFRGEHRIPIVVCSRIADYEELTIKLKMQKAVLLQSLSPEQVNEYLESIGQDVTAIQDTLQDDPTLQELTGSPLMLNIMTLAYQGKSADEFSYIGIIEDRRNHLFKTYVQRMFERRGIDDRYAQEQAMSWLGWLAKRMIEHSQTEFLIEKMQPEWLQTQDQRRWFGIDVMLISMLIVGLIIGLLATLPYGLVGGLVGGLFGGLYFWLTHKLLSGTTYYIESVEILRWSWKEAGKGLVGGMVLGLLCGLLVVGPNLLTDDKQVFELSGVLTIFFAGGLVSGLLGGGLRRKDIENRMVPNQAIWQSAKNALKVVLILGLLFGLIVGIVLGIIYGVSHGLFSGLIFGVLAIPFFGLFSVLMLGPFIGLGSGGTAFIQHFTLRLILHRTGQLPWHLVPFLNYCVDRIFLRRVGGGYIFIHRYLLEYFASLESQQ